MGTQDSGVTAHDPYLHQLTDAELEVVARDRAALFQTAIDNGDYETAEAMRDAIAASNREVMRRVDVIIAQGKALRALIDSGDLPESARVARRWSDAERTGERTFRSV